MNDLGRGLTSPIIAMDEDPYNHALNIRNINRLRQFNKPNMLGDYEEFIASLPDSIQLELEIHKVKPSTIIIEKIPEVGDKVIIVQFTFLDELSTVLESINNNIDHYYFIDKDEYVQNNNIVL
jgi:hypothetical protein